VKRDGSPVARPVTLSPVRFELEGFAPIDDPTPELVENGLHTLYRADIGYAVLELRPATFLRAARAGVERYMLEVQVGSAEQHFQTARPVPLEDLVAAFSAYLRQEDGWRSRFGWQGMDLEPPRRRFASLTHGWRRGPATADSRRLWQRLTGADDPLIADPDAGQAWLSLDLPGAIRVGIVLLGATALAILVAVFGGRSHALLSVGLLGAVICGIFGLISLGTGVMARGRGLRLDREGFAIVSRRRTQRHAWGDVAEFSIAKSLRGNPLVGYTLREHVQRTHQNNVSRRSWGISDVDGVVPDVPTIRPEALAATLESWRVRYQDRG